MCGESWLAIRDFFTQFSGLGVKCTCLIVTFGLFRLIFLDFVILVIHGVSGWLGTSVP